LYTFSLKISQKPSFTLRLSTLFIKQMYILRVVIFSLGEQNLTRMLTVFKENLVKYEEKRISREYTFILFLILKLKLKLMKFGIVVFPGSNCDSDMLHVIGEVMGQPVVELWHKNTELPDFGEGDCVILPGGFSYGDYLRSGAIASHSPIMKSVIEFANKGGYVFGICNGFQILCESGLLPGALLRNENQRFICKNVYLKTITQNSDLTHRVDTDKALKIPIAHAEGRYHADAATLKSLKENDQILFKYCDEAGEITAAANPNGSLENIAGICNVNRNVFGMMPHPERASENILGNTDGRALFESLIKTVAVV